MSLKNQMEYFVRMKSCTLNNLNNHAKIFIILKGTPGEKFYCWSAAAFQSEAISVCPKIGQNLVGTKARLTKQETYFFEHGFAVANP